MMRSPILPALLLALALLSPRHQAMAQAAPAQPVLTPSAFLAWPPLERRFASTGGGGWVIDDYDPRRVGAVCVTDFTVFSPAGERILNTVVFDAVPVEGGGVLCTRGRWRGRDGNGEGTTPLEVFIRADGARLRSP